MKKLPESYGHIKDSVCSNFDHEIDSTVVERLKSEEIYSNYPAWDWHGTVWYESDKDKFYCMVMRYGCHIATEEASTFEELKDLLCDQYGSE